MINLPHLTKQLRVDIAKMIYVAQVGNVAACYAVIDLIANLYFAEFLKCDPTRPNWVGRDYYVQSIGEAAPALYAVLGEIGFFPKEEYFLYAQVGGRLRAQADPAIPGVEAAVVDFKHGLNIAIGIALGLKMNRQKNRVFCLVNASVFLDKKIKEILGLAHQYRLDNLVLIINIDCLQSRELTKIKFPGIQQLLIDEGWTALFLSDGHDFDLLKKVFKQIWKIKNKPQAIIVRTKWGKGVKLLEQNKQADGIEVTEKVYNQIDHELG